MDNKSLHWSHGKFTEIPKVLFGLAFNESCNVPSRLWQSPGIGTVPQKNNQNKKILHHLRATTSRWGIGLRISISFLGLS